VHVLHICTGCISYGQSVGKSIPCMTAAPLLSLFV